MSVLINLKPVRGYNLRLYRGILISGPLGRDFMEECKMRRSYVFNSIVAIAVLLCASAIASAQTGQLRIYRYDVPHAFRNVFQKHEQRIIGECHSSHRLCVES